ncbi:Flavin-containing monooxygenase FMO GS-OX1 [Irineochytrium annulatum]|nr:Flavin-containing monooxygenase FMO GS-OX1 [Irineochytrium annulatum]
MRPQSKARVAIIGAGGAGVAAARRMKEAGCSIVVYERNASLGGTWVHSASPDTDTSAIYDNLRTNLPPTLMMFEDMPFPEPVEFFPPAQAVLNYLNLYVERHGLGPFIRCQTTVESVVWDEDSREWTVTSRRVGGGEPVVEQFDNVIVASGHYYVPYIPKFTGMENYKGMVMHTKSYRNTKGFEHKRILVVGGGSSGVDIARELNNVAESVHLSLRRADAVGDLGESVDNLGLTDAAVAPKVIKKVTEVVRVNEAGQIEFKDGSKEEYEVIVFATGYLYDFPFLKELSSASTPSNARLVTDGLGVNNLFRFTFYMRNPTLTFVGLPSKIDPFPLFDRQARMIAHVITGAGVLPPEEEMRRLEAEHEEALGCDAGSRAKLNLGYTQQYALWDMMADFVGCERTDPARIQLRADVLKMRRKVLGY